MGYDVGRVDPRADARRALLSLGILPAADPDSRFAELLRTGMQEVLA